VLATLAVLAPMATLDCVLQLALPSFVVFALCGAVTVDARAVRAPRLVMAPLIAIAVAGAALAALDTVAALRLRDARGRDQVVAALAGIPGHARLHGWIAQHAAERHRCEIARAHAARALALMPTSSYARAAVETCAGR
jgi:hypothetical protein